MDKAHTGPVLALAEGGADCVFLVSGGRDRCVRVWNQAMQPISSFELSPLLAPVDGSVTALDVRPDDLSCRKLTILAGTQGGDIIEITSTAKEGGAKGAAAHTTVEDNRNRDIAGGEAVAHLHSHFKGELWGLATHPTNADLIATVGDDGAQIFHFIEFCSELFNYLRIAARVEYFLQVYGGLC